MQVSLLRNTQRVPFNKFWQAGEVLRDFIRKIITILYFIHCPLSIVLNKAARFIVGQIRSFPCAKLSLQGINKSFPRPTKPYSKCPSLPLTSSTLPLTRRTGPLYLRAFAAPVPSAPHSLPPDTCMGHSLTSIKSVQNSASQEGLPWPL